MIYLPYLCKITLPPSDKSVSKYWCGRGGGGRGTLFTSPVLANLKYFQYRSCTCFRQMQGYWPDSMTWMASLILNIFHTFFYCFYYWLYISRYLLEMLIDLNFQRHNISAPTYIFVHIHIFVNTGWRHGRFLE